MFTATWIMLLVSGLIMIVTGAWTVQTRKVAGILNIVAGLLFFGYGVYLAFIFTGGTYFIPFKAFIVPFLTVGYAIRDRRSAKALTANKQAAMAAQWQTAPAPAPYTPGQFPIAQAPGQPAPAAAQPMPVGTYPPPTFQPGANTAPAQPTLSSDEVLGR